MFAMAMFAVLSLVACRKVLVEENYGSRYYKSINGFDLLFEHLDSRFDVKRVSFWPKSVEKYQLILYLQMQSDSHEDQDQAWKTLQELSSSTVPSNHNILILGQGGTASYRFWTAQKQSNLKRSEKVNWYLDDQIAAYQNAIYSNQQLFFTSRTVLPAEPQDKNVYYHNETKPDFLQSAGSFELPQRIPLRYILNLYSIRRADTKPLLLRPLISVANGAFFAVSKIRESDRVNTSYYLISDSTPFLNYYLAENRNLRLLDYVLSTAMQGSFSDSVKEKPKLLIVDRIRTQDEQAQQEQSRISFLISPPWSLLSIASLCFIVMFAWSKLLRRQPITVPDREEQVGSLVDHFHSVGRQLKKKK